MRAVVSVATGQYVRGLDRLTEWCALNNEDYVTFRDKLPAGSPSHQDVPYAFKAFALTAAATACETLLWCDASIIPIKPLGELWERIERNGYWIGNNGWSNYEWTADSAYPDLFHTEVDFGDGWNIEEARKLNCSIPHVVATTFGISLKHPAGRAILEEYYRLASKTKAFCGPWNNAAYGCPDLAELHGRMGTRTYICGPPDVRGHRHDQSCLSVIAWRLGCQLTSSPDILAYGKLGEPQDERTILLADGSY